MKRTIRNIRTRKIISILEFRVVGVLKDSFLEIDLFRPETTVICYMLLSGPLAYVAQCTVTAVNVDG